MIIRTYPFAFSKSLSRIRGVSLHASDSDVGAVRLGGVDELQARSQQLFEGLILRARIGSTPIFLFALLGVVIFWTFLSGPIVSIYRQYYAASINALLHGQTAVDSFPHPSGTLIATSLFLSFVPLFVYTMIVLSFVHRRSKIQRLAVQLQREHQELIETLEKNGVLRLRIQRSTFG